ncbi:MAG: hypothetical protein ACYC3G_02745 [Minisyncoccota bacterium]
MLKNSMKDFFIGLLVIVLGIFIMIVFPLIKVNVHLIIALPLLIIGFLLIKISFSAITEHEALISSYFLKKISRNKRLVITSKTILLCLFDDYSNWWKDQKSKGLNNSHVSFGIFIVIMAGIADKKDIVKYSKHMNECPDCQRNLKPWIEILFQKIKKFEDR